MTIAARITALFIAIATVFALSLTVFMAQRDYHRVLERITEQAPRTVQAHPKLQLYLYNKRDLMLGEGLQDFMAEPVITAAVAYSADGSVVAREARVENAYYTPPSLTALRAPLGVADTGLVADPDAGKSTGLGFWASVFSPGQMIHLTTPVLSPINPGRRGLTPEDFSIAWARPVTNKSKFVMGYVHLVIDRGELLAASRTAVARTLFGYALFTLLTSIALYLLVRRLTAPVQRLSTFAEQLATGEATSTLPAEGEAHYVAITKALNRLVARRPVGDGDQGVEHKLLRMKAERSATELSQRDDALNKANAQIDAAKEQLHRLANYDRLTSLPNQRLFLEQLGLMIRLASRDSRPVAVLSLGITDFGRISESLGRAAADHVLKIISKRLVGCLRSSDAVGHNVDTDANLNVSRFNGDEFAMVLGQLDQLDSALPVARRMLAELLKPMRIDEHEFAISPCIGIAGAPGDSNDPDELLQCASTAMQAARASDEQVLFYDAGMAAARRSELVMESALRTAIENGEMALHFQPQVDTGDGSIISAEALLRWEHPRLGAVPPRRFIPVAERMGMMAELGDWVLEQSCGRMKAFLDSGLELPRIAVNVSPQQVDAGFVSRVKNILGRTGLPGQALELGFSENILVQNDARLFKTLRELKQAGIQLSLENFGTSQAPMGYLSRHPFDDIKLDRSFVAGCDKHPDAGRMIIAIAAMARSLDMRPVAEGVESESEYRFLAAQGVRIMRGYLFSKPLPPAELQRQLVVPWHYMSQVQRMSLAEHPRGPGEH